MSAVSPTWWSPLTPPSRRCPPPRPRLAPWRGCIGLCLALLAPLAACEKPAAPSPATSPGQYQRGVWLLLDYGENRHACDSDLVRRYRYIVLQWYMTRDAACPLERIKAANPGAKVLAYQEIGGMISGPHTDGRPSSCVTREEAVGHDAKVPWDAWHLHDRAGKRLAFQDYDFLSPANLGRASYQAQCLRRLAQIKAEGYDGVLGDDTNVYPGHGLGESGIRIAEYPTDDLYAAAVVEGMRRIGPGAARLGLPVYVNVSSAAGTWTRRDQALAIIRASAGFLIEFWTRWNGAGRGHGGDVWEASMTLAEESESHGKPLLASTYRRPGPRGQAADQQYAVASFWLVWDGRQDSGWGYDVPGDPAAGFSPAWGPDIGTPIDYARVRVGNGWQRRYSSGIALVNPSMTAPQHFELGAQHRKPDGAVVSAVLLPPLSGVVLTRTDQPATSAP